MQTNVHFRDEITKENISIQRVFVIWMMSEDTTDFCITITSNKLIACFPDRRSCEVVAEAKKIRGWMILGLSIKEQDALRIVEDERVQYQQFGVNSPVQQIRQLARNVNRKLDARFEKLMNLTYGTPDLFEEAPSRGKTKYYWQ